MKKQIIIYNDDICEYIKNNENFLINELKNNDDDVNESNIYEAAHMFINDDYDALCEYIKEFDKKNNNKILVCACLGLWYGKRQVKAKFNNLHDALINCYEDVNKVFFTNKKSTLNIEAAHHDGLNIFKFYKLVNGKKRAINYDDLIANY